MKWAANQEVTCGESDFLFVVLVESCDEARIKNALCFCEQSLQFIEVGVAEHSFGGSASSFEMQLPRDLRSVGPSVVCAILCCAVEKRLKSFVESA